MKPNEIRTVFKYGDWAFEKVWDCVMQLTDEQFVGDLDYSRGSIRNHVIHIMSTTQRWIIRINGSEMPPRLAFDDFLTRIVTKAKWDELRTEALKYISTLSEADLDGKVTWQMPDRNMTAENARWEILMHIANHATDHRAQILAMLNQHFDIKTPEQDFLFYLLEAK
ncbi:MAG: DinB family protein [Anaerolineales bacterium]